MPPDEVTADPEELLLDDLTPRQIVAELDKFVIGQQDAKRAVAIALRNRWRRQQLDPALAEEVLPKNILMIGPTGVGKTEIARRLARLAKAPFSKVEASKFTEVGYVGRDVESMVRDLVEVAIGMVREERRESVREAANQRAEDRLMELLIPTTTMAQSTESSEGDSTRDKLRQKLRSGALDERSVEIEIEDSATPSFEMFTPQGVEEVGINIKEMLPGFFGRRRKQWVTVAEARVIIEQEEAEQLIDRQQLARDARTRVEQGGIIFLDEIDKIAGHDSGQGPDVSREGVQRDLLPIVEGSTVATKHGSVKTDHILFMAAGAFHTAKPSDLIPELQGRFPIRVGLDALSEDDFIRILTEPKNALTKQYSALLGTEGLEIEFTDDAIKEIARLAVEVNSTTENIGARRLATLLERVLDEVSFEAPDMEGVQVTIDESYVHRAVADIVKDQDLTRYVL